MQPADSYLETLDHEQVLIRRGRRSGLYTIVAVHSTARGPSLGGCRMWHYDDTHAALRDALRLSRAMTFKAAVADLPLGGGKGVVAVPAGAELSAAGRKAVLLDFADTVDAVGGSYITAEDVGTSSRDMSVIATGTKFVAGLARGRGGSGDPSPFTALGVEAAIRACCARAFGSESLEDRSVCVIGLGHVGGRVAQRCARAGARLTVSDVDPSKSSLATPLNAQWIAPHRALSSRVDVLVPCALGGVFDERSVDSLKCQVIAGAANNQLARDEVAALIAAHGILWAPDFVVNAGGLINIAEEFADGGYDAATARKRVWRIGATLNGLFDESESTRATPLEVAMTVAKRRLARGV